MCMYAKVVTEAVLNSLGKIGVLKILKKVFKNVCLKFLF